MQKCPMVRQGRERLEVIGQISVDDEYLVHLEFYKL